MGWDYEKLELEWTKIRRKNVNDNKIFTSIIEIEINYIAITVFILFELRWIVTS